MRTTLVTPGAVCRRAKRLAKRQNQTFSQLVAESLEARLVRSENVESIVTFDSDFRAFPWVTVEAP